MPLAIWLIFDERYGAAFWVFIGAGVSDALDGYIAKRFDRRTRLGALLDPTADKALLAGVYVSLWLVGQLPGWLVGLVIAARSVDCRWFLPDPHHRRPETLRPAFHQQAQHLGAAHPDRVRAGAGPWHRGRARERAADRRGRGDDGSVGVVVSRALGAHTRRFGTDIVSARAYRLLFWLGLLLARHARARPGPEHPDAVRHRFRDRLCPGPGGHSPRDWGVRRSLASLFVLVLFVFGLALLLVILVPLIQGQVVQLIARVPNLVRGLCRTSSAS